MVRRNDQQRVPSPQTKIAERVAQGDSRAKRYNMPGSGLVRRPPNTRCRFCKSKHLGGCGTDEARDGCLKRPRKPGDPVPRPGRMSRRRPSASQGPGGSMSGDYGGSGTLGEGSENYSGERGRRLANRALWTGG